MTPELAKATLALLRRVNLTGDEARVYVQISDELMKMAEKPKAKIQEIDKTKKS